MGLRNSGGIEAFLTEDQKKFILDNYTKLTASEMAKKLHLNYERVWKFAKVRELVLLKEKGRGLQTFSQPSEEIFCWHRHAKDWIYGNI